MSNERNKNQVVVIGGGFTGLAAAYEIARSGIAVTVLEKEDTVGGLAANFNIGPQQIEKFYHHWFNNDLYAIDLVKEVGLESRLIYNQTKTAIFLDNQIFNLSTPLDVLRFRPLSLPDRIRLGSMVLKARLVKDWRQLESITAEEWLIKLCGREVYRVVWEPLLRGKFGPFASEISAVWFWNKIVLRGGSRNSAGKEVLVYYRGGFGAFAESLAAGIKSCGGIIRTGITAQSLIVRDGCVKGVVTDCGTFDAQIVIATAALPIIADLIAPYVSDGYLGQLKRIKYLVNVCLVLETDKNLSDIYWLNVNEPDFPFVGVIEHTNFQPFKNCKNRHIVYLSKYFPQTDKLYGMTAEQMLEYSLPYIKRIFPQFERSQVNSCHIWKAPYAQPVVERSYSNLIPSNKTPIEGFYIATMAQIYPQDRGTNYAIRDGRNIGKMVTKK